MGSEMCIRDRAIAEFKKAVEFDPQNGGATKSLYEAEALHKSESLN